MNAISALLIGFVLGMRHAMDADHLVAVATLATRRHSLAHSMRQGVAWGIGHTLTLLFVGGFVLALGTSIPQRVALALELVVGAMLIALGVDVLRRLLRRKIHVHVHAHGSGVSHVHAHSHAAPDSRHEPLHEHAHTQGLPLRALAVGMTHGLAGSATLVVLSLGAVQSWTMGVLYIALFGAGSIVGMASLSVAIAIPLRLSEDRLGRLYRGLTVAIGLGSCALGLFTVYRIGLA
jgi:sulfite exporter TauE/SafE